MTIKHFKWQCMRKNNKKVEETSGVYLKDLVINNMVYEKSCISAPRNFYHLSVTVGIIANYPRLVAFSNQTVMVAEYSVP